jgi:hypothetical protein
VAALFIDNDLGVGHVVSEPLAMLARHEHVGQVAGQLGHAKASTTMNVYAHEFDEASHADQLREGLGERFGHLLARSS